MSKWLYFHASAIDSSSVTSHDTGTNIDFGAFPTDSITAIMAEEDMVYLYFKDATRFQGSIGSATEVMEQTYVRLTTAEGKEHKFVDNLLFYPLFSSIYFSKVIGLQAVLQGLHQYISSQQSRTS